MQVQDLMVRSPRVCRLTTNLVEAAALLWTGSCGALPVVDDAGRLEGIVTDRDICICMGTIDRKPSEIRVERVMTRKVVTCRAEDEIHSALEKMRSRKVRRLPVVSDDGKLLGMLSVSELLLRARHNDGSRPQLSDEDIMSTLRGVFVHCPPRTTCA